MKGTTTLAIAGTGGLAVVLGYVALFKNTDTERLWGSRMTPRVRRVWAITAVLSLVFFPFLLYYLMQTETDETIAYMSVFIACTIMWIPLVYGAVVRGGALCVYGNRIMLWGTAIAAVLMLVYAQKDQRDQSNWVYATALAGAYALAFHTVFWDAIVWSALWDGQLKRFDR